MKPRKGGRDFARASSFPLTAARRSSPQEHRRGLDPELRPTRIRSRPHRCAAAGQQILLERPSNSTLARGAGEACRTAGVTLGVVLQQRFRPRHQAGRVRPGARSAISPALGDIRSGAPSYYDVPGPGQGPHGGGVLRPGIHTSIDAEPRRRRRGSARLRDDDARAPHGDRRPRRAAAASPVARSVIRATPPHIRAFPTHRADRPRGTAMLAGTEIKCASTMQGARSRADDSAAARAYPMAFRTTTTAGDRRCPRRVERSARPRRRRKRCGA